MRAVIYCRVSTKDQVKNLSLATQQKACEDFCERNAWQVQHVFVEEGESAKTADRTELQPPVRTTSYRQLVPRKARRKIRLLSLSQHRLRLRECAQGTAREGVHRAA